MNPPPPPVTGPRVPAFTRVAPTVAAIATLVMSGTWALWPLRRPVIDVPDAPTESVPASPAARTIALDRSAFRAPLWIAPPPPPPSPPPPASPPPPTPLKLQLLAIIREDAAGPAAEATYKAMLYDPDADKMLVVAAGEKVGLRTVESVNAASLRIADAHGTRTLTLKTQARGGGAQ